MVLRVALQIDGDASGAKAAAEDAKAAVGSLPASAGSAAAKANAEIARTAALASGAVKLSTNQVQNLSFQLNDMAVMLASGQSPTMMLMQQGMQISQIFGPGVGVAGALKATGAAIGSFLLNPLNLAVAAFAAGAGIVPMFFSAITSGGQSAEALLERHEALIGRIKEAWPAAAQAAGAYMRESVDVVRYLESRNLEGMTAALQAEALHVVNATREVQEDIVAGFGAVPVARTAEVLAPFADAIDKLREGVRAGRPDVAAYRREITALAEANPELRELADGLLAASEEAETLQRALDAGTSAINRTGAEAVASAANVREFGSALRELQGIALPDLDDRARALAAYKQALSDAVSPGMRAGTETEYLAALDRIAEAERAAAAAAAARGAAARSVRQSIYVDRDALAELEDQQRAVIAGWDEMRGVASGAFSSVANDIRHGTAAGAILLNVVNRIADAFVRAGASGFETLLFGARGAVPAGLLGSAPPNLFSVPASVGLYHGGGTVTAPPAVTRTVPAMLFANAPRFHEGLGLRPREFPAILEEGETVIPRGQRAGSGATYVFNVSTPSPRAFAESRSTVTQAAARIAGRFGRFT